LEVIYWFSSRLLGTGPEPGLILKTGTRSKLDQILYIFKNQTCKWVPNSICVWNRVCFKRKFTTRTAGPSKSQEPPNAGYKLQPLGFIEPSWLRTYIEPLLHKGVLINLHGYVARLEDFVSAETLRLSRNLRDDAGALIKNRQFLQYSSQLCHFLKANLLKQSAVASIASLRLLFFQ
jgi:hypothetical protein